MSGTPVVIVESGGLPVVAVEDRGIPATVATNGYGMPITLVEDGGMPMVVEGNILPLHARIVFFGDSHTALKGIRGYADWALFFAQGKYYPQTIGSNDDGPTGWNQGVTSNTSVQMLARIGNVAAAQPRMVHLNFGGNDIRTLSATAGELIGRADEIIDTLVGAGVDKIIATGCLPRNSGDWTGADEVVRQTYNAHMASHPRLAGYIDPDAILTDFENHYVADQIHLKPLGARLLGHAVGQELLRHISGGSILQSPPQGSDNNYENGFFIGDTNEDGVANGWTFSQNSNGLTKAASLVADGDFVAQRYVASGTANSTNSDLFTDTVTPPGGLNGDLYEAWAEVEIVKAVGIGAFALGAGQNTNNTMAFSVTSPSSDPIGAGPFRGVMRATSALQSDGGNLSSRVLQIVPTNGAEVDAEFKILRAMHRKVPGGQ